MECGRVLKLKQPMTLQRVIGFSLWKKYQSGGVLFTDGRWNPATEA